jgi:hypothetical protein
MNNIDAPTGRTPALLISLAVALSAACSSSSGTLYDLVNGPVDRPSALNVVSGRATGIPRSVRVDVADAWDVAFAVIDDEPVLLPRGWFEGIEPSSGILVLEEGFETITSLPDDSEAYETEEAVPITIGTVYAIRSRSDPSLSLPCHIYAKVVVDSIGGDPARALYRALWNPNCDDTNVTPEESP